MSGASFVLARCQRCGLAIRQESRGWSHTGEAQRIAVSEGLTTRHVARPGSAPLVLTWELDAGLPVEIADEANANALRRASHRPASPGSFRIFAGGRVVGVAYLEEAAA